MKEVTVLPCINADVQNKKSSEGFAGHTLGAASLSSLGHLRREGGLFVGWICVTQGSPRGMIRRAVPRGNSGV